MTRLPGDLLDRLWKSWNEHNHNQYYTWDYARVSRRSSSALAFENWIYAQGGIVQRDNKKCYLEFNDEQDAIVFRLKYL